MSLPIILTIVVIVAILFALWYRQHPKAGSTEARVNAITNHWADSAGFVVILERGASVSDAALDAIEKGMQRTFDKSACAGYTKNLEFSGYTVAILKGVPDSNGDPALQVPAGPYAGTEFDRGDGTMLVAGESIDPKNKIIVIPEHGDDKLEHLATIMEYETEHIVAYDNDRDLFERTKVHGIGTGHPIIPDCGA